MNIEENKVSVPLFHILLGKVNSFSKVQLSVSGSIKI